MAIKLSVLNRASKCRGNLFSESQVPGTNRRVIVFFALLGCFLEASGWLLWKPKGKEISTFPLVQHVRVQRAIFTGEAGAFVFPSQL